MIWYSDRMNDGFCHFWTWLRKKIVWVTLFISSLFIAWCYSFLYSLRLPQSSCSIFACRWVSLCPAAGQGNARLCELLIFVASRRRDQASSFPHRHRCSSALNLAAGFCVNSMFRSGHASRWGQRCGWAEFRNALFQKICPNSFLSPFHLLAAVSVIENLLVRGLLI